MDRIRKLLSCEGMVPDQDRRGPLPGTREAYASTLRMAWPCMVESFLLCMVSFVDTMMVGVLGPHAISAVGITNQPKYILLAAIISLNMGVTAVTARRKGQEDQAGANRCMKQSGLVCLFLSLFLAAVGILFAQPLLVFAGADQVVLPEAMIYFRIISASLVANGLSLTINAAQRGVGKTRIAMVTNLTANGVNLVFNYLLINGVGPFPRWGVAGAAVATFLGNTAAFAMALCSLLRRSGYLSVFSKARWRPDRATMSSVGKVASSAFVEQVCLRLGFFLYAKIVAGLGMVAFAAHQICMNIINISFAVGDGLSVASSTLVGQSLGAERPDMGRLYGSIAQRVAFVISTGLFFLFIFGRFGLIGLFTDDAQVIAMGAPVMVVIAFTTHIQTSQVIKTGCLRGAGDTKFTAVMSLISITFVRPSLTWLLCYPVGLGLLGAWIGLFIDQTIRMVLTNRRFRSGKWALMKL